MSDRNLNSLDVVSKRVNAEMAAACEESAKAFRQFKWASYRLRRRVKNKFWAERENLDYLSRLGIIGADATSS